MSWSGTINYMVRGMVGDLFHNQYADVNINRLILISAQFVKDDIHLSNMTVDIEGSGLSPDPTDSSVTDGVAITNLIALKAACMIDQAEARLGAKKGVAIKDTQQSIDTKGIGAHRLNILNASQGWCEVYTQTKLNYWAGNSKAGQAVLGPFRDMTNQDFNTYAER